MLKSVDNLIQTLQDDLQWHSDLAVVLENKLDAMRHFDLSRLEALTGNEQRLAQAIALNEKKRRDAVRAATMAVWPQRRGQTATASELAQALAEPQRSRLMSLTSMLREVMERVGRLNRINAIATHKIMGHFDHIFQIIAQSGRDIGLYGKSGKKSYLEQNRLVDAMA
ncbi:MAG: flagellar protein FlgN [Sedimentisphaerales bacterium]|nr:flagellar protein FlgN [Sedimentisphaerales bacterium]